MYYRAKAASISAWSESSSGGSIRTTVRALLSQRDVDEAVMTASSGLGAETIVIKNAAMPIPGTCYSYNSSLVRVVSSLPQETRRVVVALPCQARRIREMLPSTLIISPICFQTVSQEGLMKGLEKCGLSVEERKIRSIYRKHGELLVQTSKGLFTVPFNRYWSYLKFLNFSNPQCAHCVDHFGASADIVVGDDKHRSNMILVRTLDGLLAFESAAPMLQIKRDRFHGTRLGFTNKSVRQKVAYLIGKTLYRRRR